MAGVGGSSGSGSGAGSPTEAGKQGTAQGGAADRGLGHAVDFVLSNARLVLGVGGAAVLGIATLAVKRVYDRAVSVPSSPLKQVQNNRTLAAPLRAAYEEPAWPTLGHGPSLSRSMVELPQERPGEKSIKIPPKMPPRRADDASPPALTAGSHRRHEVAAGQSSQPDNMVLLHSHLHPEVWFVALQ
uniref:Uncharacterized protein n=1 Tax=Eptatretus burgeri TaxID=7764 RepID=A0A8C4R1B0_EPTBU